MISSKQVRFTENWSTPIKESNQNSNKITTSIQKGPPGPLQLFSPGLSPIHDNNADIEYSIQYTDNSSIGNNSDSMIHKLDLNDSLLMDTEGEHLVNSSIDTSSLNMMSLIEESLTRSIVVESPDSSLHSMSVVRDSSFSFNKSKELQSEYDNYSSESIKKQPFNPVNSNSFQTQPIQSSANSINTINNSNIKLAADNYRQPLSRNSSYLKEGSIFVLAKDENGSPVFIPIANSNSMLFHNTLRRNTQQSSSSYSQKSWKTLRETSSPELMTPIKSYRHLLHSPHDSDKYFQIPQSPMSHGKNMTSTSSPNHKNSRYFSERIQRRSITSVLNSLSLKY